MPAVEEALYDSRAMREFVGIDLGCEAAPDETTVCKFWHLLEAYELGPPVRSSMRRLSVRRPRPRTATGQGDVIATFAPKARDLTHRRYRYGGRINRVEQRRNRIKSKTRARVEHAFLILKRKFPRCICWRRNQSRN